MSASIVSALDTALKTFDYYNQRRKQREREDEREREAEERARARAEFSLDFASGDSSPPPLDPFPEGQMPERIHGLDEASMIGPRGGPATEQDITAPPINRPYTDPGQMRGMESYQNIHPLDLPGATNWAIGEADRARAEQEAEVEDYRAELEKEEREDLMWEPILERSPELQAARDAGFSPDPYFMEALRKPLPFEDEIDFENRAQEIAPMFGEGGAYETGLPADLSLEEQKIAGRGYDIAERQAEKAPDQMLEEMLGFGYTKWQLGITDEDIQAAADGDMAALDRIFNAYKQATAPKGRGGSLQPPQPKSALMMFSEYMGISEKDLFKMLNERTETQTGDPTWGSKGMSVDKTGKSSYTYEPRYEMESDWTYPDLRQEWDDFNATRDAQGGAPALGAGVGAAPVTEGGPSGGTTETYPDWYNGLPDNYKALFQEKRREGMPDDEIYSEFFES